MTGRACSICSHPQLAEIDKLLVRDAGSKADCAVRFNVSESAVQRHRTRHLGLAPRAARGPKNPSLKGSPQKSRFATGADGRCSQCGISLEKAEPETLLKRAERLMFYAETIVERAARDDDYRLQLQAIDRARQALELTMKAVGMLQPENLTVIDNRQVNQFAGWSTPALVAIQIMADELGAGKSVEEAVHAVLGAKESAPALPPARSQESEGA
jgi:hypothetical protein